SGMQVLARVLGLGALARLDALPDDLTEAVILHVANSDRGGLPALIGDELARAATDPEAERRARELTEQLHQITRRVVLAALVEPVLSEQELDEIPEPDLEMLMRIATGRQAFDAAGRTIGVEPLDAWATFRDQHHCAADCPSCRAAQRRLSTVDLGGV